MKKRLLAGLLLLAMVIGLCSIAVSASDEGKYLVGYGKVDLDPLYTDEFREFAQKQYPNVNVSFAEEMTFTINIGAEGNKTITLREGDHIPLALQGNSHTDVRLNIGNQDDNGDGIVDENDGIFATAIAVTAPGDDVSKTVIMMATDTIGVPATVTAAVRKNLFEKHGITGDRVMIDGSHSHHGPHWGASVDKDTYPEVYYLQAAWYYYVRLQMTQAAEIAIADRVEATMSRGTIEAEEALCATGEVGDYLNEIRAANAAKDPDKYGGVEYVTELTKTVPNGVSTTTIEGYGHETWTENGIKHVAVPELYEGGVYYNGVRHDQSTRVEATRKNAWRTSGTFYAYSYPKTTDSGYVDDGLLEEGNFEYIPSSWQDGAWLTAQEVEDRGYAKPDTYATGNNFNSNFAIDGVGGRSLETKYIRLDSSVSDAERLTREYIDSHLVDSSLVLFDASADNRPYIEVEKEFWGYTYTDKEYIYVFQDIWVAAEDHAMTEVDDTLLVLQFSFDKYNEAVENGDIEGSKRKPILLVNWRAHTNKNRKSSADWMKEYTVRGFYESFYQISSDWCNALRYGLEFAGYRVAYFSGASGNVNGYYNFAGWYIPEYVVSTNDKGELVYTPKVGTTVKDIDGTEKDADKYTDVGTTITINGESYTLTNDDEDRCVESMQGYAVIDDGYVAADASHLKNQGAIYGTELAEVALELINGENPKYQMTTIDNPTGGLRSLQSVYLTRVKEVTLAEFLAAGKHQAQDYAHNGYDNDLSRSIGYDVYYWELEPGNTETAIIDEEFVVSMLDENGYPGKKVNAKGAETGETYTQAEIRALYPSVTFDADGKVSNCTKATGRFVIAAYLHANSAMSDYRKRNSATGTKVELNAIMLCDQIAIITGPGELYDRYSDTATWTENGYVDSVPGKNLWESLHTKTYGEPFFLGYCNASTSYMPSKVTYEYNLGSTEKAAGSYETQITSFAKGTGEEVMLEFDWLLDQVNGNAVQLESKKAYCQHCGAEASWNSLADYLEAYEGHTVSLNSGHYYITEDTTVDELTVTSATSVCLDLNGYTLTGTERVFVINGGGVLSVQDSSAGKTGKLQGQGCLTYLDGTAANNNLRGAAGGAIYVSGTLNLYSGTLTQSTAVEYISNSTELGENQRFKPGNGGVVYVDNGTFNMYGGKITGGKSGWAGGNLYGYKESNINLYGGTIDTGAAKIAGTTCTCFKNKVLLAGDAKVDNLLIWPDTAEAFYTNLTIKGTYTGTTKITFREKTAADLPEGKVIGLCDNANISGATITVTNASALKPKVIGSKLVLDQVELANCPHCGKEEAWTSLTECFEYNETITSGHYYVDTDNYQMAEQVIADGVTVCLDLHGNDLVGSERAFEIASGGTLNIMDTLEGGTVAGQGFAEVAAGAGTENERGEAGGTVLVASGGTLNLRSGTLTLSMKDGYYKPASGGVVDVSGTFNMYGGAVRDGISGWFGGNIMVERAAGAQFNMYGGAVTGGTCAYAPRSYCVAARNTTLLANDASVQSLLIYPNNNLAELLTVQGVYTGTAELSFHDSVAVAAGLDIGTSDDADLSGATLTVNGHTELSPLVSGTDIKLFTLGGNECAHCGDTKNWLPLSTYLAGGQALTTGHYYVDVDNYEMPQQTVADGVTVCLDLNGYTLTGSQRAFVVSEGGTLNVQDGSEAKTGKLQGSGFTTNTTGKAYGGNGGTVSVAGTLNLYSGTLTQNSSITYLKAVTENVGTSRYKPGNGGVLYVTGTFNMHGGTVTGGNCGNAGGNLYAYTNSTVKLSGGAITGGKAGVGGTNCVMTKGAITLENAASVELLQLWPANQGTASEYAQMLTIKGAYTGTTALSIKSDSVIAAGLDIGTSDDADLSGAMLTVSEHPELLVEVSGTDIKLAKAPVYVAKILSADGTEVKTYESLTEAMTDCQEGQRVVLLADAEEVTVSKNMILDLGGKSITGTVTVAEGVTLYCMDSANVTITKDEKGKDVYTFNETGYGYIANISGEGEVKGAEATEYQPVYLKITEKEGTSFHAVDLRLTHMSLRPNCAGMYYKSNFNGDSKVKALVKSYGVALSVKGTPTAETMGSTSLYTRLTAGFGTGEAASTSSILADIMKTTQGSTTNRRNAKMQVYGRAYIQLEGGVYVFGYGKNVSLQQCVEAIDAALASGKLTLDAAQQEQILAMYNTYIGAMKNWEIPTLKALAG